VKTFFSLKIFCVGFINNYPGIYYLNVKKKVKEKKISPLSLQVTALSSQFTCHMQYNYFSIVFKFLYLDFKMVYLGRNSVQV